MQEIEEHQVCQDPKEIRERGDHVDQQVHEEVVNTAEKSDKLQVANPQRSCYALEFYGFCFHG